VAYLHLVRPTRVRATPAQIILPYLGLALLLLGVFHKPVGLSEAIGDTLVFAGIGCNLLCLYVYRRHKTQLSGAALDPTVSPAKQTALFWILLVLIAVISLSIPWWMPYTGTLLPISTNVIIAIVTWILCTTLFLIGWRRGQRKV